MSFFQTELGTKASLTSIECHASLFFQWQTRNNERGEGGGLACRFLKIKKIALILEIVPIFGLNFLFKI